MKNIETLRRALAVIGAAEASVVTADPMDRSKVIVGLRIPRDKKPCASLGMAFDDMVDIAEKTIREALAVTQQQELPEGVTQADLDAATPLPSLGDSRRLAATQQECVSPGKEESNARDRLLLSMTDALIEILRSTPYVGRPIINQITHNLSGCVKDLMAATGLVHGRPSDWQDHING